VARRIMSMKNSSDSIGNRTRDLPVCSDPPHKHFTALNCQFQLHTNWPPQLRNKPFNADYVNSGCLLKQPSESHKQTVWGKNAELLKGQEYITANVCAVNSVVLKRQSPLLLSIRFGTIFCNDILLVVLLTGVMISP
jgi:hypothetical protein